MHFHVFDSTYGVDYLFEFYSYFNSAGSANVAYAIYSACAGPGFSCGPAYNCPYGVCPIASVLISSGALTNIGSAGQKIGLAIRWSNTYGYVLDYQNPAQNSYRWTVTTLYPSGTYSTTSPNALGLGDLATAWNPPVCYAYFFQIGATMSSVPANGNWGLQLTNTQYLTVGGSTYTYLNHAETLYWGITPPPGAHPEYESYWKEVWVVSSVPAQSQGISISGSGNSSSNQVTIHYTGGSQNGNVQLW